jgi:hypothetical protein
MADYNKVQNWTTGLDRWMNLARFFRSRTIIGLKGGIATQRRVHYKSLNRTIMGLMDLKIKPYYGLEYCALNCKQLCNT